MDADVSEKFDQQAEQLAAIYRSVERTRKYFMWTLIISVVAIVLPLLGLFFVVPSFLGSLGSYGNLGL